MKAPYEAKKNLDFEKKWLDFVGFLSIFNVRNIFGKLLFLNKLGVNK